LIFAKKRGSPAQAVPFVFFFLFGTLMLFFHVSLSHSCLSVSAFKKGSAQSAPQGHFSPLKLQSRSFFETRHSLWFPAGFFFFFNFFFPHPSFPSYLFFFFVSLRYGPDLCFFANHGLLPVHFLFPPFSPFPFFEVLTPETGFFFPLFSVSERPQIAVSVSLIAGLSFFLALPFFFRHSPFPCLLSFRLAISFFFFFPFLFLGGSMAEMLYLFPPSFFFLNPPSLERVGWLFPPPSSSMSLVVPFVKFSVDISSSCAIRIPFGTTPFPLSCFNPEFPPPFVLPSRVFFYPSHFAYFLPFLTSKSDPGPITPGLSCHLLFLPNPWLFSSYFVCSLSGQHPVFSPFSPHLSPTFSFFSRL